MQFPIAFVAAVATLVIAAPTPGVTGAAENVAANVQATGPSLASKIWGGITSIPRKLTACVGSCANNVEEAVTVQIPAAISGAQDGAKAGAMVYKYDSHEGYEAYAKGKHEEQAAIKAAEENKKIVEEQIHQSRLAQQQIENEARDKAQQAAADAINKALAEYQAALEVVEIARRNNDEAAYKAAIANLALKDLAVKNAKSNFEASQFAYKKGEEARINAILGKVPVPHP